MLMKKYTENTNFYHAEFEERPVNLTNFYLFNASYTKHFIETRQCPLRNKNKKRTNR